MESYKVGYKRPPKHTQWKTGESGNRSGKSKKTQRPASDAFIDDRLDQLVEVPMHGRMRRITLGEVLVRGAIQGAAGGNLADARNILTLIKEAGRTGDVAPLHIML